MGMQAEFNWYIVLKDKNILYDVEDFRNRSLTVDLPYSFQKDDYRIYPMDTPLPIIYNGRCVGMGSISNLIWRYNQTVLNVDVIVRFPKGDSAAQHYEDSFKQYKRKQQEINDGGKVDLRAIVNPEERVRL